MYFYMLSSYISILFFIFDMSSREHDNQQLRGSQHNFLEEKIKLRFQVLKKVGSGAYGHVWKVMCKQTKALYAIKKVFMAFQNQVDSQRVYRQISLLMKIKHDNIIKLRQVIASNNKNDVYLLFDFMESDVFKAVKNRVLDLTHKKYIVYQLACALKYLHSSGVVHRDLKPSNILINANCGIKICDFGLSRSLKSQYYLKPVMTEFIATRWYRSPEVLLGSKCYQSKSDMWSLGCLIYELYSRRTLLPGQNTIDQIKKILEFKGFPTRQQIQSFKAPKGFQILAYFNLERKDISEYYDDLQIEQIKEVINHLLQFNPKNRWSAEDLLQSNFLKEFKNMQDQSVSGVDIKLGLNQNMRYKITRYKAQIMALSDIKKQRNATKRLYFSQRNSHKNNSSFIMGKIAKSQFTTFLKNTKQFRSAHVSPNQSILQKSKQPNHRFIKAANKLTVFRTNSSSQRTISKSKSKQKSKQKSIYDKQSNLKMYLKPNKVKDRKFDKENYENKLKNLKREKIKHYRTVIEG